MILRWALLLTGLTVPSATAAQNAVTVQGRVTAVDRPATVEGARVELQGHGQTETSATGAFRFERVLPGSYALRVTAVGYAPAVLQLEIRSDTTVTVQMTAVGYRLDSVVVRARTVDVEGLVQDKVRDLAVVDADILSSQSPPTLTNRLGQFRLEDVWEGSQLALSVSAFGYLPVDTVLIPTDGERYVFNLVSDPVAERMIARQIERLEQRSRGRLSVLMRPLDREALLRSGGGSLRDMLRDKFGVHGRRIQCILVDDRVLPPSVDGPILGTMSAKDVERVEVLFGGVMVRIYTREFIRRMISGRVVLRPPVYVAMARPPVCY
ncbi:MAG: carboxypeptidase-like regulatory domain-containing protein [Gemmatimonadales bacterium]